MQNVKDLPPMKKLLFTSIIVLISFIGCKKDTNKSPEHIPDGVYTGTFQRQLAFGGGAIANVTLTFTSNTWTEESDMPKYPALCYGTYLIENQKIIFSSDCIWTAEFDGTLILGGEYTFSLNGNQLEFVKDYRGPFTDSYIDVYSLTK